MPNSTHQFLPKSRPNFFHASLWVVGLTLCASVGLSACSTSSNAVSSVNRVAMPYKIDIVQGNVVTREQSQALRPGMARDQVRDLLGSPLLASMFHADRWDYVFTFRRQGQLIQSRRLTVFFKDAVLQRFESDELPSESEFVASLDSSRKVGTAPALEATEAQLKAFADRNPANSTNVSAPQPVAMPASNFPSLETPRTK